MSFEDNCFGKGVILSEILRHLIVMFLNIKNHPNQYCDDKISHITQPYLPLALLFYFSWVVSTLLVVFVCVILLCVIPLVVTHLLKPLSVLIAHDEGKLPISALSHEPANGA